MMQIQKLVQAIADKHNSGGFMLNSPASLTQIAQFERIVGVSLPDDFLQIYLVCNGFECQEDLFVFNSLDKILEFKDYYNSDHIVFAEYMIYSDSWLLNKVQNHYQIFNAGIPITDSLHLFLESFLKGGVFEDGGLYDLHKKAQQNSERTSE